MAARSRRPVVWRGQTRTTALPAQSQMVVLVATEVTPAGRAIQAAVQVPAHHMVMPATRALEVAVGNTPVAALGAVTAGAALAAALEAAGAPLVVPSVDRVLMAVEAPVVEVERRARQEAPERTRLVPSPISMCQR